MLELNHNCWVCEGFMVFDEPKSPEGRAKAVCPGCQKVSHVWCRTGGRKGDEFIGSEIKLDEIEPIGLCYRCMAGRENEATNTVDYWRIRRWAAIWKRRDNDG